MKLNSPYAVKHAYFSIITHYYKQICCNFVAKSNYNISEITYFRYYSMIVATRLNRIVIPDSVKEIKSFAFSGRRVKTMILGKGIRKIEECSLCDTIDTLIFQGKTDKILKNGFDELFSEDFDDDTTLEFPNDFSESFTLCYADVTPSGSKKNPEYRFDVEWAHVKGADGYEIKTEGITQNVENGKNHGKLHIPSKRAANEDADYYGSISIRPFRYVNGRKQYGRTYRTYCEYETGC